MSLCTPTCPICLKNFNNECVPVTLQPCGHGGCQVCIQKLIERSEVASCPVCRTLIVNTTPNYDLKTITDEVESDPSFWGRRLLEILHLPGQQVVISEKIRPYTKLICNRLVYNRAFRELGEVSTWGDDEKIIVNKIVKIFTNTMKKQETDIEEAFMWLKILNFNKHIDNYITAKILNWYEIKIFLDEMDALWIVDALSI